MRHTDSPAKVERTFLAVLGTDLIIAVVIGFTRPYHAVQVPSLKLVILEREESSPVNFLELLRLEMLRLRTAA